MWQTTLHNLTRNLLMLGAQTLNERYGARQNCYIAAQNTVHIIVHSKFGGTSALSILQVRVYRTQTLNSLVYLKPFISLVILGVFHIKKFFVAKIKK